MLPFLIISALASAIAAVSDLRTGRIPNWLTLGAVVLGIGGHAAYGFDDAGWQAGLQRAAASLAGLLLCSIAPGILYWRGAMGGGDLKLFAAIGALLHPLLGIETQMYSLVVAAVFAPVRLAYEGQLLRVLAGSLAILCNPFLPRERRRSVPAPAMTWFRLGPAIFAGSLLTLLLHGYALLGP